MDIEKDIDKGIEKDKEVKIKTRFERFKDETIRRFDLRGDNASQREVIESIDKSTEFRGTNLWLVIFATFIASLGLNVNSTAVIIGAMLISPLMGPIMGLGLSFAINDFQLMKKSLRNFMWMVIVSVLTSTLYFLISPFSSAQSELLARTSPTTYDVIIALVGGLSGMLAQTRKDRATTVISGVAIATALMPPLCTAGFGLATGELRFFVGATYLFLINTVFIALAAYIMSAILKYRKLVHVDKHTTKRMNRIVLVLVILVVAPSTVMTINIMRKTSFEANADKFITTVFQFEKTLVMDYSTSYKYDKNNSKIEVRLVGEVLPFNVIDNIKAQTINYNLPDTELVIKQTGDHNVLDFSSLQKNYVDIIDEKNATIQELRKKLANITPADTIAVADLSKEISFISGNIASISLAKHIEYSTIGERQKEVILCVVTPENPRKPVDTAQLTQWLSTRLKRYDIEVVVQE